MGLREVVKGMDKGMEGMQVSIRVKNIHRISIV